MLMSLAHVSDPGRCAAFSHNPFDNYPYTPENTAKGKIPTPIIACRLPCSMGSMVL